MRYSDIYKELKEVKISQKIRALLITQRSLVQIQPSQPIEIGDS